MPTFTDRLKHAWNAFNGRDRPYIQKDIGPTAYYRMDRPRMTRGNERSIITAIYNRIALDVSAIAIHHVQCDENDRFREVRKSPLDEIFSLQANIDQTGRAFVQDAVLSMFDEGVIAIVPTETSINPEHGSYDIYSARVARILQWMPKHIRVRLYNELEGKQDELVCEKKNAAIVENPFFAVMNEPNSTMQRLIRKLNILDAIDEQSGSGKLDLIIQLPYVVRSEAKRQEADRRRKEIEQQLTGSKYGIAYADGTEKIVQLNRSIDNNLMSQIEYLTNMVYSQLGITTGVLDGTADEKTMLNYYNRTVEPILSAITDEVKRKFLTRTARTQHQTIMFFRDPFKLVPVADLANIADRFTRNEILSSNEMRAVIGYKPSDDPRADELTNKNLKSGNSELPMAVSDTNQKLIEPNEGGQQDDQGL